MKKKLVIYTATNEEWKGIKKQTDFASSSLKKEGFIHCSFAEQTIWVANKHYLGEKEIMLLCIDSELLKSELRIENLKGPGELFPHVYGRINTDSIVKAFTLKKSEAGIYRKCDKLQRVIESEREANI